MRKFYALLLLFAACRLQAQITTVNAIIGDESFVSVFGREPNASDDEQLRIRTHLGYVSMLLRSRDCPDLSPEQKVKRLHLLDLLDEYAASGKFPKNTDYPGQRRPCFIDHEGRICAVGYLVQETEGRDKAEMINKDFQYATIYEMHSEWLNGWLERWGLSAEEAATIQPAYQPYMHERQSHQRKVHTHPSPPLPRTVDLEIDPASIQQKIISKLPIFPGQNDSALVRFTISKKGSLKNFKMLSGKAELAEVIRLRIEPLGMRPATKTKGLHHREVYCDREVQFCVIMHHCAASDTSGAVLCHQGSGHFSYWHSKPEMNPGKLTVYVNGGGEPQTHLSIYERKRGLLLDTLVAGSELHLDLGLVDSSEIMLYASRQGTLLYKTPFVVTGKNLTLSLNLPLTSSEITDEHNQPVIYFDYYDRRQQ